MHQVELNNTPFAIEVTAPGKFYMTNNPVKAQQMFNLFESLEAEAFAERHLENEDYSEIEREQYDED